VIFFEPKRIYNGPFDGHHDKPVKPWAKHPASEVRTAITPCRSARRRSFAKGDLTVLAYGTMVHVALAAVEEQGNRCRGHRPATLVPLDIDAIENR
jgi:2-oxoisovalerate dehydrogenase E1 component beta subunit